MRGGTIRAGNAIGIPPTLREFAIEPEQVLKQVGLPADLFDDPENVMTYATFGRLLARCAELSGCGHFGLRAGGRSGLAWLGRIGFVARKCTIATPAVRRCCGPTDRKPPSPI
jgi:hypothetical protein